MNYTKFLNYLRALSPFIALLLGGLGYALTEVEVAAIINLVALAASAILGSTQPSVKAVRNYGEDAE